MDGQTDRQDAKPLLKGEGMPWDCLARMHEVLVSILSII